MFLSDREIRLALTRGAIRLSPCPPVGDLRWSPISIDLTLAPELDAWQPSSDTPVDPMAAGFSVKAVIREHARLTDCRSGYVLPPGGFVLGWTEEVLQLPADAGLAAIVEGKSSLARIGLSAHITAPIIHPGFGATNPSSIQLEIFNHNVRPIRLTAGMPVCQILFVQVYGTPEQGYAGQFQTQGPMGG